MNCVVLVVEDDPLVRMGAVAIAEESADKVYEAENADAAILVLEAQDDITLLSTDVDMPGMIDGLELAEVVHARWPLVRLIVTSGRIAIPDDEVPDDGVFIGKPYYAREHPGGDTCRARADRNLRRELSERSRRLRPVCDRSCPVRLEAQIARAISSASREPRRRLHFAGDRFVPASIRPAWPTSPEPLPPLFPVRQDEESRDAGRDRSARSGASRRGQVDREA